MAAEQPSALGGRDPKGQRTLAHVLFGALVVVVVGSLLGQWAGIRNLLGDLWFWIGNQGWEYLDLGRVWQSGLFLGLLIWLALMLRAIRPALAERGERRQPSSVAAKFPSLHFGWRGAARKLSHLAKKR